MSIVVCLIVITTGSKADLSYPNSNFHAILLLLGEYNTEFLQELSYD